MRFLYAEAMCDPLFYLPLARALEEAGWDGMTIPDSLCYPEVSDSKYPYTPDGNREFLEDKPFIEPFSLIPAMGAVTSRIRFTTFVVKLPIRHPVLVAKSVSSVAVLTQNRFDFGVGLSPWPDDFRVTGIPWARRGKRMNEAMEIIRNLLAGGFYRHAGETFEIESIKLCPVPSEPVPILVGGHSDAALRRAARLGDGWLHAGGDPAELSRMIGRLNELRREYGRGAEPFDIRVISPEAYTLDGVRRLEDLGVTHAIVGFRNSYAMDQDSETLQHKVAAIQKYTERIIEKA